MKQHHHYNYQGPFGGAEQDDDDGNDDVVARDHTLPHYVILEGTGAKCFLADDCDPMNGVCHCTVPLSLVGATAPVSPVPLLLRMAPSSGGRHPTCLRCNVLGNRDERADASFCTSCQSWLESPCDDIECQFCTKRPGTPGVFCAPELLESI